jgi:23S rRNA (guanosine2251-2'-O)-methyltransferase
MITVLLHNIRSAHNVGAIIRSAECFGVREIAYSGYTPFPSTANDSRLPHIRKRLDYLIHKTALGTEKDMAHLTFPTPEDAILHYRQKGYYICGLEQSAHSLPIQQVAATSLPQLLIPGSEVEGLDPTLQVLCDVLLEIAQLGKKESLNVSVATAIALYEMSRKNRNSV